MYMVKLDELRCRRKAKNWTMQDLSCAAGLPRNAVCRIENGKNPRTHPLRARAIAQALHCKVTDIFTDEKEASA